MAVSKLLCQTGNWKLDCFLKQFNRNLIFNIHICILVIVTMGDKCVACYHCHHSCPSEAEDLFRFTEIYWDFLSAFSLFCLFWVSMSVCLSFSYVGFIWILEWFNVSMAWGNSYPNMAPTLLSLSFWLVYINHVFLNMFFTFFFSSFFCSLLLLFSYFLWIYFWLTNFL